MLDDLDVCDNTTPLVGPTADSVVPADPEHVRRVLAERAPVRVIACGKQAEAELLQLWPGPLLAVPHPASRLVTDELFTLARWLLPTLDRRLALRQRRGSIDCESLDGDASRPLRAAGGDYSGAAKKLTNADLLLFETLLRQRSMTREHDLLRAERRRRQAIEVYA
jgi:hypothetical protein